MPKQFLRLFGESLFQKTVRRALVFSEPEDVYVVTNEEYRFRVCDDLDDLGIKIPQENILLEPEGKNTLPAICYAMMVAGEGKFAILPSDHVVGVNEEYFKAFKIAEKLSNRFLITFGVKPRKPHPGYGYIRPGENLDGAFRVEEFHEKPDVETAERLIREGCFWNSGMFLFDSAVFKEEVEKHTPEMLVLFDRGVEAYADIPEISVDYGILEKSERVAVVPIGVEWSDMGSFDAIYEYMEKDESGNAVFGKEVMAIDSERNLVIAERLTALIDVDDLLVIDTDDALLVAKRGSAEKVKELYNILKGKNDRRATVHRTAFRPWGSYTVLEENNYKIKRITVKPGRRLSLQRHYHRSEHWIVVNGTARIVVDGKEILLRKGESTFVPAGSIHRIENPGKIPLEIIEVQIGDYLEEDDIERFEDDFDRIE